MTAKKTQEAPGELELVREFVNSLDVEDGTERLGDAGALAAWLVEHRLADAGLTATRTDRARAVDLREALRAILLSHTDNTEPPAQAVQTLDDAARRARLRLRFDDSCAPALEPEARGVDGALGRMLATVHTSIADGTWSRLKACREHTCEWAFYDHTKNRSGAWCTMDVCGNRAKARAYRERRNDDQTPRSTIVRG
jgi:predicted RNA-binding Zn ribbon-like protein